MEKLKAKLKKQGGFTLVEMLIVVAIIAILIAISIPLVNGALEKARDATDQANERAAKAEALLYFMGTVDAADLTALDSYVPGTELIAKYDAKEGKLVVKTNTTLSTYGQCTGGDNCYTKGGDATYMAVTHVNKVIMIQVTTKGVVNIRWVAASVNDWTT